MKSLNALLSATGTNIFTTISVLAARHGAINLGQGFPDTEGPADVLRAAAEALLDPGDEVAFCRDITEGPGWRRYR